MAVTQNKSIQSVPTWKTVVVVLLLLLFYPLGLIFMFIWMRWPMWVKLILVGVIIFWFSIMAILSAVIVTTINPLELMKQARDANRMTNLAYIQEMMITADKQSSGPNWLCNGQPGSCEGLSTTASSNQSNGTGWVKVNFDKLGIKFPVTISTEKTEKVGFPIDPVNSNIFYYRYCSDGKDWEINTKLESNKYVAKMATDGGNNNNLYEVGSNLNLCK